jgi:uncharacterized repeat protein (TIGR03843 family)
MAAFDAVINNGDRKGAHIISTVEGPVHGVDHGVCFNVDDKLRTILWGWQGEALVDEEVEVLQRLVAGLGRESAGTLGQRLRQHLSRREVERTRLRAEHLLSSGRLPRPRLHGPTIPWPPF